MKSEIATDKVVWVMEKDQIIFQVLVEAMRGVLSKRV